MNQDIIAYPIKAVIKTFIRSMNKKKKEADQIKILLPIQSKESSRSNQDITAYPIKSCNIIIDTNIEISANDQQISKFNDYNRILK